jgi:hypothetical protein
MDSYWSRRSLGCFAGLHFAEIWHFDLIEKQLSGGQLRLSEFDKFQK